jgi:hypothetical protein
MTTIPTLDMFSDYAPMGQEDDTHRFLVRPELSEIMAYHLQMVLTLRNEIYALEEKAARTRSHEKKGDDTRELEEVRHISNNAWHYIRETRVVNPRWIVAQVKEKAEYLRGDLDGAIADANELNKKSAYLQLAQNNLGEAAMAVWAAQEVFEGLDLVLDDYASKPEYYDLIDEVVPAMARWVLATFVRCSRDVANHAPTHSFYMEAMAMLTFYNNELCKEWMRTLDPFTLEAGK